MKSPRQFHLLLITLIFFNCNSKDENFDTEEIKLEEFNYATSVSYYNNIITFYFPEEYAVGQFANGDYWVHNNGEDVIINRITPVSSTTSENRIVNGAMINPEVSNIQGYDSNPRDMGFNSILNVDPGFTQTDLVVSPGTSVVKSISMESTEGRPIIQDAAILSVLASSPPEGAFRPSYTGNDKSIIATLNDIDYNVLGNYTRLGNEPNILEVQSNLERVWLEHCTEWVQRDIHPLNNMPAYGRDLTRVSGEGLILLQLDFTQEEKETLLIRMVQYGLDIYGVAQNGGVWYNNGGHNLGRKMPLLLAAKVLGNNEMLAYADKEQYFIFQDDQQHFYISQQEVNLTNSDAWNPDDRAPITPYNSNDRGIAEWGIRHLDRPEADNANWDALYRHVNGPAQMTHILAANLMDVKAEWNWNPTFDYGSRYYQIENSGRLYPYVSDLWAAYVD